MCHNDIVNNVIILLKLTLIYFGIKYAKLSSLIYIEKNLSLIILNFFFEEFLKLYNIVHIITKVETTSVTKLILFFV